MDEEQAVVSDTDLATTHGRRLEKLLKSVFDAVGDGLGQQVRSVEDRLPNALVRGVKEIVHRSWFPSVFGDTTTLFVDVFAGDGPTGAPLWRGKKI